VKNKHACCHLLRLFLKGGMKPRIRCCPLLLNSRFGLVRNSLATIFSAPSPIDLGVRAEPDERGCSLRGFSLILSYDPLGGGVRGTGVIRRARSEAQRSTAGWGAEGCIREARRGDSPFPRPWPLGHPPAHPRAPWAMRWEESQQDPPLGEKATKTPFFVEESKLDAPFLGTKVIRTPPSCARDQKDDPFLGS